MKNRILWSSAYAQSDCTVRLLTRSRIVSAAICVYWWHLGFRRLSVNNTLAISILLSLSWDWRGGHDWWRIGDDNLERRWPWPSTSFAAVFFIPEVNQPRGIHGPRTNDSASRQTIFVVRRQRNKWRRVGSYSHIEAQGSRCLTVLWRLKFDESGEGNGEEKRKWERVERRGRCKRKWRERWSGCGALLHPSCPTHLA